MPVWVAVAGSIACSLPFLRTIFVRPELRSLAFRNLMSRRGQTILVVSGVILATAVITSAGVVGDSLRASVRRSEAMQLGPIDEEVLTTGLADGRRVQSAFDRSPLGRDVSTLPFLSLTTTVVGRDFVARIARAQVLEMDFARAEQFGGDPKAVGISGNTPAGDRAVIGADLASELSISPGHRVSVNAYGTSRTFVVDRVLPRTGVAGLAPVTQTPGGPSLNLFVPPGTIASMLAAGPAAGDAQPVSVIAVSNGRREPYSAQGSNIVSASLRAATAGLDAQVEPVRELLRADADARSRRFAQLFRVFGFFSVLGGLLLLVLTFLMLARDRARSMGILRANGLRRSRHVAALSLEGWCHALAGAAAGALVGIGIAALVVISGRDLFANQTVGRLDLTFAVSSESVVIGFAIGFVASLVVVVTAAFAASRRNIVRMMKGRPDPALRLRHEVRSQLGGTLVALGGAALAAGIVWSNGVASIVGPAIAAIGVVVLASASPNLRLVIETLAVAVFVWSALAVTVMRGAFTGLGVALLATEGIVMSASALAFVAVNHEFVIQRWSSPRRRRALARELGLAYSRTAPPRTVLIIGMYAIALFTLTLLVTIGQLYSHNVRSVAERLGGAAALEVSSDATRPVPPRDVVHLPGVTRVTPTSAIDARLQDRSSGAPVAVTVVGFDPSFVGHGSPPIVGASDNSIATAAGSSASIFDSVARDPTKVIVGADVRSDRQSGLPGARVRVGDSVELRDPLTGATRALKVAGLVEQGRWGGADHVFAARAVVERLSGGTAASNLLYLETDPGTSNDVVAAVIDGTHLPNGAFARSFRRLAADTLSAQRQFLQFGAGYAAVGLVADLVGIAVLMVDRIRERRRQIATLRALGFRGVTVERAFRVEAAVVASEGVVVGAFTGLVLAWRLGAGVALGRHLAFSPPVVPLVVIAVVVVVASLAATTLPARRAGRVQPAPALRSDE